MKSPSASGYTPALDLRALSGSMAVTWWQWLVITATVTVAIDAAFIVWLLLARRRQNARALAGFIPDCLVLFRRLLGDQRVPRRSKLMLAALIGYLAMPFDLVPDFIPVAGQLDDAIVVAVVLRTLLRAGGPDILREQWPGPAASLNALMRLACGFAGTTVRPARGLTRRGAPARYDLRPTHEPDREAPSHQ
jgi:uncharacterized membrane protein YkvA (DUF1232 family)